MSASLEDYQQVVGSEVINELLLLADRVKHRRFQHINSTAVGGGVTELLTRLVPLFRGLGIDTTWDVIKGDQAFFEVTKTFHNALHGGDETITEQMFEAYRETTNMNLYGLGRAGDLVVVHDPQPAALIAVAKEPPCKRTASPRTRRARSNKFVHTVKHASGSAAASTRSTTSGTGRHCGA